MGNYEVGEQESTAYYQSHMRSQAIVCAGASREKDGS